MKRDLVAGAESSKPRSANRGVASCGVAGCGVAGASKTQPRPPCLHL